MNKNCMILCIILSFLNFSNCFASGWHIADDIVSGNFTGNYSFLDDVVVKDVLQVDKLTTKSTVSDSSIMLSADYKKGTQGTAIALWGSNNTNAWKSDIHFISGSTGSIRFFSWNDVDSWRENMIVDENGNVGIGVISPVERLDIDGNIKLSGVIVQEDWKLPVLTNGWINFGSGYSTVGYMKDKEGFVHLKGLVKGGGVGGENCIFVLPFEYRPSEGQRIFMQPTNPNVVGRVDISSGNGCVYPLAVDSGWVSLEGIVFDAN